ncbi:hypothetical protein D0T50_01005 [Bacteroides sp. 214]|uniref:hypothetical protein n=1 Tax=Bacteroides sp. 214 TaxID=2302935 RepID=UPI0019402091|nr:hypothetical protein [Bacteroides sp. 214]NDW11467.1 hypothetical protein [Bacteroides sp. 214]
MKKAITYPFVILLVALICYGGVGINIISFCCADCHDAGIEVIAEKTCCEIHEHSHDHVAYGPTTEAIIHEHESCCTMERISFDWGVDYPSADMPQPAVTDLRECEICHLSHVPLIETEEAHFTMPTGPPLPPREYLALLNTLLI